MPGRVTCHRCFYYREVSHGNGECMNRPPHAYTIATPDPHGSGRVDLETFSTRPPIRWDDWCAFFSDPNPAPKRPKQGTES